MVIFDKDGTLICFHSMWVPWAKAIAARLSTATGLDLRGEIFYLLGYCPLEQRVRSGLLAECTISQIRQALAQALRRRGVVKAEAIVEREVLDLNQVESTKTLREIRNTRLLFEDLRRSGIKVAICTADSRSAGIFSFVEGL